MDELSELVESVDSPRFLKNFAGLVSDLSCASYTTMFVHSKDATPVYVYDDFKEKKNKEAIKTFLNQTHEISPFYRKCVRGIRPGLYLMSDLYTSRNPDVENLSSSINAKVAVTSKEELGYITHNWPTQLSEIDMAIPLQDGRVVEIGVYRNREQSRFDDDYPEELGELFPILKACFCNFWSRNETRFDHKQTDTLGGFTSVLSNREREVIGLILKGHSSESIGLILGISITTVKTHRKTAYQKLKISTQAELMSLYLECLNPRM
ncbi:MAG: helix-turn-helix transcriptional regulator [Halopseudomonas aestusnigri]